MCFTAARKLNDEPKLAKPRIDRLRGATTRAPPSTLNAAPTLVKPRNEKLDEPLT
jgi:hypothetical protein